MPPRSQPYRIDGEPNADKMSQIDEMFQILFDDNRNGSTTIDASQVISGILTTDRGGTGTGSAGQIVIPTPFTLGSVVFAGVGGNYAQDNANFFWDDTNNRLGIGTNVPTASIHIKAGTTAASTAPLKLTSGPVMTSPEAGAIEFTTDDFFGTITTGAARKGFVLDNGSRLTSGRVPFATTNGRLVDDADLTFSVDTLSATKVAMSSLTSGRVPFASTAGLLIDDADFTFSVDTLTATKIVTTALTDSGINSGRVVYTTTGGLLSGDASMQFSVDTLTIDKVVIPQGQLNVGTVNSVKGILKLFGNTSGTVTIQPAAAAGTYTLTLPINDGDANQVLSTDGAGILSWAAASGTQQFAFTSGSSVQAQNTTGYYNTGGPVTTDERQAEIVIASAVTITKIYAYSPIAPASGQTCIYTLRKNEADTAVTVTITGDGSAALGANSSANSVSYAAGDRMCIKVVTSATAGNTQNCGTVSTA